MEYDDDSDCPSIQGIVDFPEDAEPDIDDDISPGVLENEVDNSAEEEEAVEDDDAADSSTSAVRTENIELPLNTNWRIIEAASVGENINIDIARVDDKMLSDYTKQAKHLMKKVDFSIMVMQLKDTSSSEAVQYTNCFLPPALWLTLRNHMDKKLPENKRCTMREIELLMRLLFSLGAYSSSLSFVLKHVELYPPIATIIRLLPRGENRVRELLSALDPSEKRQGIAFESEWLEPFRKNKFVTEMEQWMSCTSAELAYAPGFDLCIDDDKVCYI